MQHVVDRQYASIWSAINAKNFKQGMKIIDKKLSKCPDQYLEALKLYIRVKTSQLSEKLTFISHIEELAARNMLDLSVNSIEVYEQVLAEILPDSTETWAQTIGELRWKFVKSSPKDEKQCLHAFQTCLSNHDLHHARQIINVMEKNFPKNRNYVFWNVTTMVLFSLTNHYPDDQRKLWRSLALAQITKLASANKQYSAQGTLPIKSIQTPQEILLLHRTLSLSGNLEKSIQYLEDPQLGPESDIAKGEWELWRLRLKILSEFEKWKELFDIAIKLLKRARTKDACGQLSEARLCDWIVWDSVITSAVKLDDYKYFRKVKIEIEAHLDPDVGLDKTWKRNASLAHVRFHFENINPFSNTSEKIQTSPLSVETIALVKYLNDYGDTSMAYSDLRPFLETLRDEERSKLFDFLASNGEFTNLNCEEEQTEQLTSMLKKISSIDLSSSRGMARSTTIFKIRYLFICYSPKKIHQKTTQSNDTKSKLISKLYEDAIRLFKTAIKSSDHITKEQLITDRHPIDDIAVLASMCLVKLALPENFQEHEFSESSKFSHILRATILLEFASRYSKYNFQISLVLLRFYSYLGCGSLAVRTYQRLSIKHIQLDTLSYTLLDRISTFHPHSIDDSLEGMIDTWSPVEYLKGQQQFYKNANEQISASIQLSFQHGNYNSIFGIKEVSDRLASSISAIGCMIESRKTLRLLNPDSNIDALPKNYEEIPLLGTSDLSDNNDYLTFPSFESSEGPTFHEICCFLPPPTVNRIKNAIFREQMLYILSLRKDANVAQHTLGRIWLERYTSQVNKNNIDTMGMTFNEALAHEIYHSLALIAYLSCERDCWTQENLQICLGECNNNLLEALSRQRNQINDIRSDIPALQNTLHSIYTAYEVGNTLTRFCEYISSHGASVCKTQLGFNEQILDTAVSLVSDVVYKARSIKSSLNEGGWIDRVLSTMDNNTKKNIDENFMEEWTGQVVESWNESLVGFNFLKELKQQNVSY